MPLSNMDSTKEYFWTAVQRVCEDNKRMLQKQYRFNLFYFNKYKIFLIISLWKYPRHLMKWEQKIVSLFKIYIYDLKIWKKKKIFGQI